MATHRYPTAKSIGDRVEARRLRLGLSRAELGELLGIGEKGFGHKVAGRREFTGIELSVMAQALGVTTDYLTGQEDETDISQREVVRFFDGLPPHIQEVELEHLRSLHKAHVAEEGRAAIGSGQRQAQRQTKTSDEDKEVETN